MKKILIVLGVLVFSLSCTSIKYTLPDGTEVKYDSRFTKKKLEDLHIKKTKDSLTADLGKAESDGSSGGLIEAIIQYYERVNN